MNISIFGLGYVGCISMGCLAQNGHRIIGVDINEEKVNLINHGKPSVIEKDIDTIIAEGHRQGRIFATMDHEKAVKETEISIICVGTPSSDTGHVNLDYVKHVAAQIGESLKDKNNFHTILIRSTVPPGTHSIVSEIIAQKSEKKMNTEFAVVSNPEFLREGTSVYDYYNPPYTIIASKSTRGKDISKALYKDITAPVIEMSVKEAEILKYIGNAFHALKVCFANEVGNICQGLGIDSHRVMEVFCQDTKLNISSSYLKPGFAYGGSCLPKDLKALNTIAHDFYLDSPVLNAIEPSNRNQIDIVLKTILRYKKKKIAFLGLSFKPGTDDLRFSPILEVIQQLLGKGYQVSIYDKNVHLSKLTGVNKTFIQSKLPHIEKILKADIQEVIKWSEIVVIANREEEFGNIVLAGNQIILDLVRIKELEKHRNYYGICW